MAAAISSYFPQLCRSHLAQPARCLDEDYQELPSAGTLSSRRRQFIERCSESRGARREPAPIPPDISVKRTRDELAKSAQQNASKSASKRLNIESGWFKVEEVRKKFEGANATSSVSFSRSFESPPRRRLADSLFASFKLPRRRPDATGPSSMGSQTRGQQPHKRKSAVELLAESKAFYVKSETVLDRKQELPLRMSSGLGQAIASGGCHVISSGTLNNEPCCMPYGSATLGRIRGARRTVSAGDGLQSTLRRLLDHSDSRESVYSPPVYAVPHKIFSDARRLKENYADPGNRSHQNSGTISGTSSSGTSGSKARVRSDPEHDKSNRPRSFGDARVFFPESFVIPRQRPSEAVVVKNYSIPSSYSSPENIELPDPVVASEDDYPEDVGAISPPAQYAHSTQSRYVRSNSHGQAGEREPDPPNINSHKSLPDLHSQARCYSEHTMVSGCESIGRSPRRRRHSNHQRTASCSSKGTRSNHSSIVSSCEAFSEHPSPGDENYPYNSSRCGSGFARDSGGSSGHYTQRSAPAPSTQHAPVHAAHRTDSGSSTQHSHNRYSQHWGEGLQAEWQVVSAPLQFQDGAPSPPPPLPPPAHYANPLVGIHFQASAPPPQFQDEAPFDSYHEFDCYNPQQAKCYTLGRTNEYSPRDYARFLDISGDANKQPIYAEPRPRARLDELTTQQVCSPEEVTSPLGTFKRQRCLRYKQQRRPKPILRSKSDISDRNGRYRRSEGGRSAASAGAEGSDSPDSPEESPRLHRFFQHLGLEERTFDSLAHEPPAESPVFFSDVSTVDSNQLVLSLDYTVQGPAQQKSAYRNTEPPSVVERNARIIKWLCNCRKTQLTQ